MSLAKNNPVSEATVVAVETATGQSMDVVAFANLANGKFWGEKIIIIS